MYNPLFIPVYDWLQFTISPGAMFCIGGDYKIRMHKINVVLCMGGKKQHYEPHKVTFCVISQQTLLPEQQPSDELSQGSMASVAKTPLSGKKQCTLITG